MIEQGLIGVIAPLKLQVEKVLARGEARASRLAGDELLRGDRFALLRQLGNRTGEAGLAARLGADLARLEGKLGSTLPHGKHEPAARQAAAGLALSELKRPQNIAEFALSMVSKLSTGNRPNDLARFERALGFLAKQHPDPEVVREAGRLLKGTEGSPVNALVAHYQNGLIKLAVCLGA